MIIKLTNEPEFHKPVRTVLEECDPPVGIVRVVRGGGYSTIYVELTSRRDAARAMDILSDIGFDVKAIPA